MDPFPEGTPATKTFVLTLTDGTPISVQAHKLKVAGEKLYLSVDGRNIVEMPSSRVAYWEDSDGEQQWSPGGSEML